ncbi:MAG: flagellar basal body-associated FliL family protein [Syntrophales bacterium]
MTKKVSLDTLDIEDPAILTDKKRAEAEEAPRKPPAGWYRSRLLLISGAVFLALFCAGLFLFFFTGSQRETSGPAQQSPPPVAAGKGNAAVSGRPGIIVEEVKDFLIPLKAGDKESRVLSIDMAFEIDPASQALFREKTVLVRGAIFNAVNGTAAEIPKGKNGIEKVREKIIASLETLLGKDFVKNVWVTKFVVL